MKRITFERIKNPNVIAYNIQGVTQNGMRCSVGEVKNPIKTNPVIVSFKLNSADVKEPQIKTKAGYAHSIIYQIPYSSVIQNMDSSATVIYDGTSISKDLIIINAEKSLIVINDTIPKSAELEVSLYIDGIEFICESDEYKSFVVSPIIDAQITAIGYHSKLV